MVAYLIKNDNGVRRSLIFYSKSTQQPKPTGLGDQFTQPKDEWGRDAQIYLAQIRAEKIKAEVEAAVMAAQVSVSRDEPITERLLQYSLNPQEVRIVLSKLLRWAKKKPDIRTQTSLMTICWHSNRTGRSEKTSCERN